MKSLLTYLILAYLIFRVLWAPLYLSKLGINGLNALPCQHYLGSFGPAIAGFIVTFALKGKEGVIDWRRRIFKWRVNWLWYLIAFASTIGVFFLRLSSFNLQEKKPRYGPQVFETL